MHFGVGPTALNLESKEEEELMASRCWKHLGEKPYKDASVDN
jgi:hypothetical protein